MAKVLYPAAQKGVGVRIAHDPGDPLITSHCPFCGSGQVAGRSDGTISCDFCGQVYIVRVQPAFPGMPQMPGEGGAPSDIGPDGGVLPPDAIGPDGLPMGGEDPMAMGEEDAEGFPGDEADEEEGEDPEGFSGPPEGEDDGDEGPPPPPKKDKSKSKKGVRTYRGLGGEVLTEDQYVRHLAAGLSGGHPAVLAALREAARGDYNEDYRRGRESSMRHVDSAGSDWVASPLERADSRNEPRGWYDGYLDHSTGRAMWHTPNCPDHGRGDAYCVDDPPGGWRPPARKQGAVA